MMVDWQQEIRKQLIGLKLAPVREAEIVEELAQHLDDRYAELLASGATPRAAERKILAELYESELLRRELRSIEPPMAPEPGRSRSRASSGRCWSN